MQTQADITTKVTEALSAHGYISTMGLSKALGCSKGQVVTAFDEIEAAGIKMMRIRGIGGGAQFIGKRMRRAA